MSYITTHLFPQFKLNSGLNSGQGIKIYNLDGTSRAGCVIKGQENNFFNSRHNPSVSCLAFHPLMVSVSVLIYIT